MNKTLDNFGDGRHSTEIGEHYVDVENSAIRAIPPVVVTKDTDFMRTSKEFWGDHKSGVLLPTYNSGLLNGTYNKRVANFEGVMDTISGAVKNTIRSQFEAEEVKPQIVSEYLKLLDSAISLLDDRLSVELEHGIDGELFACYLQASLNTFIMNNISKG